MNHSLSLGGLSTMMNHYLSLRDLYNEPLPQSWGTLHYDEPLPQSQGSLSYPLCFRVRNFYYNEPLSQSWEQLHSDEPLPQS
ncbi:hypothetical protein RRG08_022180 [Elysia crispata]|uniref:Uncharacterized protein n=1 Tax=Elysia crispata TaxID=231223 RepID=A0AAE1E020_9GAST|nr:hypothetical protein RRG08_022180 [Elysia crispata]